MTTFKGVIFDLDGLLVDTETVYEEGWLKGIEAHAPADFDKSIVKTFAGKSVESNNEALYEVLGDWDMIKAIRQVRIDHYHDKVSKNQVQMMPYAKAVLHKVKDMGYKVGLATASLMPRVSPLLKNLGLEDFFDGIVAADLVENSKPAPDIYLKLLEKLGLESDQVIAFEDSDTGVAAAKNAGIKVYQVFEGKDFDNLKEAYNHIWS